MRQFKGWSYPGNDARRGKFATAGPTDYAHVDEQLILPLNFSPGKVSSFPSRTICPAVSSFMGHPVPLVSFFAPLGIGSKGVRLVQLESGLRFRSAIPPEKCETAKKR